MDLRVIDLHGTPRNMGRQHGEQLREDARAMAQTRLDLSLKAAREINPALDMDWCLALADRCVPFLRRSAFEVYEECLGIAEAAGLTMPQMVIGNGYTDYIDLLRREASATISECTSLALGGERTAGGLTYVAQTWDMNVSARPYMILVRRRPERGPASLTLTTAGCLSLIGINEAGIAIGNTNLVPGDARPGVFYLAVIHHALAQTTFEAAKQAVMAAPRISGHYYYLAGPEGEMCGIETSAEKHRLIEPDLGAYVHTNHYLDGAFAAEVSAATAPSANSLGRQARMEQLIAGLSGPADHAALARLLSDHSGEHRICRHSDDPNDFATCGAAVMCPQRRTLWATAGNPCEGDWTEYFL